MGTHEGARRKRINELFMRALYGDANATKQLEILASDLAPRREKPGMVRTHGALWRLAIVAAVISGVILSLVLWR